VTIDDTVRPTSAAALRTGVIAVTLAIGCSAPGIGGAAGDVMVRFVVGAAVWQVTTEDCAH